MEYTKPPLTLEQQATLLIQRGLVADKDILIKRLKDVNYYRLSGYFFPYRTPNDTFYDGTLFENVWRRYTFDRRLRLLVMDAIERIEISLRSHLTYNHAHVHGAFGYVNASTLPGLTPEAHREWLNKVKEETERSKEEFVRHFKEKYGASHTDLPIWMVTEIMAFGHVLTMFKGIDSKLQKSIAEEFRIPDKVFISWLGTLNVIRNICAHHGRLWNRTLGFKPLMPYLRKNPIWHKPVEIQNDKIFVILTICKYLLGIVAPQSAWPKRLNDLLNEYSDVPKERMGFPEDWKDSPIWN